MTFPLAQPQQKYCCSFLCSASVRCLLSSGCIKGVLLLMGILENERKENGSFTKSDSWLDLIVKGLLLLCGSI